MASDGACVETLSTWHVSNGFGTLAVGQQIGEFTGQAQKGTIAAKVNNYTIFERSKLA